MCVCVAVQSREDSSAEQSKARLVFSLCVNVDACVCDFQHLSSE